MLVDAAPLPSGEYTISRIVLRGPDWRLWGQSRRSFRGIRGDFRYYPERRHLPALQYLTKRAKSCRQPTSLDHLSRGR